MKAKGFVDDSLKISKLRQRYRIHWLICEGIIHFFLEDFLYFWVEAELIKQTGQHHRSCAAGRVVRKVGLT